MIKKVVLTDKSDCFVPRNDGGGDFRNDTRLKGLCLMIFLLFFCVNMAAQDVDSLFAVYQQSTGNKRIEAGNILSKRIFDLGHIYSENQFAAGDNIKTVDATHLGSMALYKLDHGDISSAISLNQQSLALYRELNDSLHIIHRLLNLYVNYSNTGQREKALNCLQESLDIATRINDRPMIAHSLLCLANLFILDERHRTAADYFAQALDEYTKLEQPLRIITCYTGLSIAYRSMNDLETSYRYALIADSLCRINGNNYSRMECFGLLTEIYIRREEWQKAITMLDSAIVFAEQIDNKAFLANSLTRMGEVLVRSHAPTEKASSYLLRAVDLAQEIDKQDVLSSAYDHLYTLYKPINPALSLDYLEKGVAIMKLLYEEKTQEQLSELHVQYETAQKQFEIERQKQIITNHKTERTVFIIGLLLILIILVFLWQMLRYRTKRNRALADMNATKDKFFSIISHDLKNPAIAQRKALQLLLDHVGDWDVDSLSNYYDELLKSADSQIELLYNLLNWAQVQTNRITYTPAPFDLVFELHNDLMLIRNQAEQKGVVFETDLPDEAIINGDCSMLTIVVRNLLTNAVKYTSQDDKVLLKIAETSQGRYTVTVADTGIGMDTEQLHKLFHLDREQSRAGTAGEPGSGLGLIVCKEFLEKHGSTLHVESAAGKGSKFSFTV